MTSLVPGRMCTSLPLVNQWFRPVEAYDLGICRALFFAVVLGVYGQVDFSAWGDLGGEFWMPIWLFQILGIPPLSVASISALQLTWKVSLVTSCLGLATRASCLVSWLLGTYLLGLVNCYGKINHQTQIVVLVLGILAVSRCGDSWSLDRWWQRKRSAGVLDSPPLSGDYAWPIRLVWLVMVSVFFAAGVSKLRQSGWEWVWSENLSLVLIKAHYGTESPWNSLGLQLARFDGLCRVLAAVSLGLELGSPLTLISRRARAVLIPGLLSMQAGIFVFMGTDFIVFLGVYAFWVPWRRVMRSCDPKLIFRRCLRHSP